MKALDILNQIINSGSLPDCGTLNLDGSVSLRDYFGAVRHKGEVKYGTYLYLYAEDYADILPSMPPADLCIETEASGNVWLWTIDDE